MPTWQGRLPGKAFYPFFSRGTAVQADLEEVRKARLPGKVALTMH